MPVQRRTSPSQPRAATHAAGAGWMLVALIGLGACDWLRIGAGGNETLVLVDVEVARAVPAFTRIRFSIPGAQVSPKVLERNSHDGFRFGYYIPDGRGSLLIRAEALRTDDCVVGLGMHQTKLLAPGQTIESGKLSLGPAPTPCPPGTGAAPGTGGELPEGIVLDGPGPEDVDAQNSTASMSASWSGFGGSITGYEYKIAVAADCSGKPVHGPVGLPAGSRMHMATGLTLPEGVVFNCVRSFDHTGRFSIWKASDGITIDLVPPTVVEYRPAADSAGLERAGPVLVVFSEPLDPASVAGNVELTAIGAAVAIRSELTEGGKTLAIRPESPLPLLAPVKVTLAAGLRDRAGNALTAGSSASFTTRDGKWLGFQHVVTQDRNDVAQLERELALALAVEPGGRAVLAWEEPRTAPKATWIHVVRHEPSQGWSSAHQLDTQRSTRASEVDVAIRATGEAAVVYAQNQGATDDSARSGFASLFDPTLRSWVEPAQPLSAEPAGSVFGARAAYGPTGELHVFWAWFDPKLGRGHVEGRRATGSAWTVPTAIGPTGPSGAGIVMRFPGPSLAFDALGFGHLAIAEMAGPSLDLTPTSGSVSIVTHTPNGWTSPNKVSGTAGGAPSGEPRLGIDGAGNAAVLWPQGGDASILLAAHRDQTSDQWSPPILPAGIDPLYNVHLAMNTAGNAIVLYNDRNTGIRLRRFQRGVWAKEVRVREEALLGEGVGVDARGLALAIWREGAQLGPMARILVARESSAGGLATPVQLNKEAAYGPARLAVLPDGRAFAAWVEGTPLKLMVARFE